MMKTKVVSFLETVTQEVANKEKILLYLIVERVVQQAAFLNAISEINRVKAESVADSQYFEQLTSS